MKPAVLHLTAALARGAVKIQNDPLDHPGRLPHEIYEMVEQWFVDMVAFIRRRGRKDFTWDIPLNLPWPLPEPTVVSKTHRIVTFTQVDLKAMPPGTANEWRAR